MHTALLQRAWCNFSRNTSYVVWIWPPTEFWKWKKGSTWVGKNLRRVRPYFHNSFLLIKMQTSKIGNNLSTEPFWKGRDALQVNFHICFFPCEGASWYSTISIIICFLKGVTNFLLTCFHNSFGNGYSA